MALCGPFFAHVLWRIDCLYSVCLPCLPSEEDPVHRNSWLKPLFTVLVVGGMMWPAEALAQRGRGGGGGSRGGGRVTGGRVAGGGGGGVVVVRRPVFVSSFPAFRPYYFFDPFYDPYYWGGFGWYGWYPQPGPFFGSSYGQVTSTRIQVTPRQAEVYVDGYLVGLVDDFDGFAQRLHLPPGEHEIQVYMAGYRTLTQRMLFRQGQSYKIQQALEALPAGEPNLPRPTRQAPFAPASSPASTGPAVSTSNTAPSAFGSLSIRVQPADASVLIDGEPWQGPASQDRLVVQLAQGVHRVEVRKDGYQPFTTTVTVKVGETTTLNVSLPIS